MEETTVRAVTAAKDCRHRYLREYDEIVLHEHCKHVIDEFELYSYKVGRQTNEIRPIADDKDDHCIDALPDAVHLLSTAGHSNFSSSCALETKRIDAKKTAASAPKAAANGPGVALKAHSGY